MADKDNPEFEESLYQASQRVVAKLADQRQDIRLGSVRFHELYEKALRDAEDYASQANSCDEERKAVMLKWAAQRREDADFYLKQAWYAEQRESHREAAE